METSAEVSMLLQHDSRKKRKAEAANIIHSSVHNALKVEVKKGGSLGAREAEVLFSVIRELQLLYPFAPICYICTQLDRRKPLQGDLDGYQWHRRKHSL